MSKKTKTKPKSKPKISRSAASKKKAPASEMPELVSVMTRIAERLDALEQKMETVIQQTSDRVQPVREMVSRPPQSAPAPAQTDRPRDEGSTEPNPHRNRVLYQAVCADCSKPCEVPFKPSGERPIYCKECFAARKASRRAPQPQGAVQQRQVRVIPNGVGKVTISELVSVPAPQAHSDRKQKQGRHRRRR